MQVRIITTDDPATTRIGTYMSETEAEILFRDEWGEVWISKDRISHYSITED